MGIGTIGGMKAPMLSWLMLAIAVSACVSHDSRNSTAVPESTFVNYLADRSILKEEARIANLDSATFRFRQDSLNRQYGFTDQQVDRIKEDYQRELTRWRELNDRIVERLEHLQRSEVVRPKFTP
jgi:hypothetical protein